MSMETAKKKGAPQILKTNTALNLAEKWVSNMTRTREDDPIEAEQEVRPHRLGLGAKVSRKMQPRLSDDPLDRKLQARFDAGRRKHARSEAEFAVSSKNAADDSDSDDESERKSQAFGKKGKHTSMPR
ncbi:unnamed protein product [Cochlearia groenlandica]